MPFSPDAMFARARRHSKHRDFNPSPPPFADDSQPFGEHQPSSFVSWFSRSSSCLTRFSGGVVLFCLLWLAAANASAVEPWVAPPGAAKSENPVERSSASIAQGRTLYLDRCADCHGKKCRGDGSGGADLECRPSDLTTEAVSAQSDGTLFWKLTEGRRPMPAYGRKLSEEQRWHVVNYLRSLAPKQKQPPTARKQPAKPQ